MKKIRIGILKEGKIPIDKRVPITPKQAVEIKEKYPFADVVCEKSNVRCFQDHEYESLGIQLVDDVSDCDILVGVKEVPQSMLIEGKTYLFFSHTIKKQEHNKKLLQEIVRKKIRLIDWECLTNTQNQRIIAFGRYAGIVGAYNGLWTYGKRYNLYHIKRACDCADLDELKLELKKVKLPPIKIAVTGGGRVAKGTLEILLTAGIRRVTVTDFLENSYPDAVFCQLNTRDYNSKKGGGEFNTDEFYKFPDRYSGNFLRFTKMTELLIAAAYWDPHAPVLFEKTDMLRSDFAIKVIADITCDIHGSIPSTIRASTIQDPVYDFNPFDNKETVAFSDESNLTVMAIDNLPCELPVNASHDFGRQLIDNVLPSLLMDDTENIIKNATITENGVLTERYAYLQDYIA